MTLAVSEQLTMFTLRPDLAAAGRAGLHLRIHPEDAAPLEAIARDIAAARGWSRQQLKDTIIGIRIVLGIQPDDRPPVRASEVECLTDIDLPVWTVLEASAPLAS